MSRRLPLFWNHSKQHSSKTYKPTDFRHKGFGTIRNNTALKPKQQRYKALSCFGTIRNNTALKLIAIIRKTRKGFGTIRNNTALKPIRFVRNGFGVLEPFETTQL